MKRKRRTKAEIEASKLPTYEVVIDEKASGVENISLGLGDTVEKVLEVTGVAKLAKWVMGEDCGCEGRKELLNKFFPYRKPECLLEHEHQFLDGWFSEKRYSMRPTEQKEILAIYNRVFKVNMQPTSCGSCLRDVMNKLETLYNSYKEEDANS